MIQFEIINKNKETTFYHIMKRSQRYGPLMSSNINSRYLKRKRKLKDKLKIYFSVLMVVTIYSSVFHPLRNSINMNKQYNEVKLEVSAIVCTS